MSNKLKRIAGAALSLMLVFGLAACTVEKTEEGNLPEYEVTKTEEGNLPKYDVDAPDVDIEMTEKTIKVPDIDINGDEDGDDEGNDGDGQ